MQGFFFYGSQTEIVFFLPEAAGYGSRLMSVDASDPGAFPCEVLEDVSTLDKCQVQAIKAALTQEISLIQGPPGTGNYFSY